MDTLSKMLATLDHELREIPVELVPAMIAKLAAIQGGLAATMLAIRPVFRKETDAHANPKDLLTIPQVAKRLAISDCRAYELARQGKIPIVKVGKYVRVEPAELAAWIIQHRGSGVDDRLYAAYSTSKHDREGVPKASQTARLNPGRSGQQDGSHGQHRRTVGARRDTHSRVDGTADHISGS